MIHDTAADTAAASLLATTAPEGTIDNLHLPWSFLTAIDVLLAHATTDNTRGAMTGILLERHAECTYLVATDGYAALVLRTVALDGPPGTLVLDPASVRAWRARYDASTPWEEVSIDPHPATGNYPNVRAVFPTPDRTGTSCVGISTKLLARLGTVFRKLRLLKGVGEAVVMHIGSPLDAVVFSVHVPKEVEGPVRDLSCVLMPMRLV